MGIKILKKPRKYDENIFFDVYSDGSGYDVRFNEHGTWFCYGWNQNFHKLRRLHKWLGEVIQFIEYRRGK